ncbi:MAG TPA: (Fe-S)-binding protein [Spirochaetia bacterium]|nr:(Fe-S)-binding protein [Spirochaetia bacterium]
MKKDAADFLAKADALVNRCDRCGACLSVCPLYALSQREIASARGKISAVRGLLEGGLTTGSSIAKAFEFCLLCRACTEKCPSKIETDEVMVAARQYTAGKLGRKARHRLVAGLLGSNVLLSLVTGVLDLSRRAAMGRLSGTAGPLEPAGSHYREMLAGPASFPPLPAGPGAKMPQGGKIAYFRGCAMKIFFPAAAGATVNLLKKIAGVVVPAAVCCGSPHLAHGMLGQAMALARTNIERFGGAGLIVTDCASCGHSLKEYGHRLADDPRWADKAQEFSQKVMGLSEYLYHAGYRPGGRLPFKVTYHDPCHLGRGQGIKREPRELLRLAGNYVELPSADRCCGGAGTFHLDFPEEARRILNDKVADIAQTGAEVIVTECPACMMQLAKGEQQSGRFVVKYISQVL